MVIKPENAGMCADRLERITHHFETRYIEPRKIAGCQILVQRRGHTAYHRSLGYMDLERQKPMRDDTLFRIYSMTKPIASVALMMLFEEAHFQLKDPVSRYIPEWKELRVYESGDDHGNFKTRAPHRPMTLRDTLMHMTGVATQFGIHPVDAAFRENLPWAQPGATLQTLIESLATLPLKFDPGTRWNYGPSTDVVARLVEIFSGQSFDTFLRERIFRPLGMRDTGFFVPEGQHERLGATYGRRRDKTLRTLDDPATSAFLRPPTYFSGQGGLVSTTADYLRFCEMLLAGGELEGARILGHKTLELMTRNHLSGGRDLDAVALGGFGETAFDGVGFGLGFAVSLGDVATQSIGANGDYYWGGAASTLFWIDPAEDLCVIFMTQFMPSATFNFRGQLRNLVYSAIES